MKGFVLALLILLVVIIFGFVIYKVCLPGVCFASLPGEKRSFLSVVGGAERTSHSASTERTEKTRLRSDIAELVRGDNVSREGVTDAVCGNGMRELNEGCDDGNTTDGDGCSASCKLEGTRDDDNKSCDDDAVIGDRVWHDHNANGVQDPGEPGISGVTVKVIDGNDKKYQTTDALGHYKFSGLCNKVTVVVAAETLPEGCYQTHDRDGNLDHSYKRDLGEDGTYGKADFGYKCPQSAMRKQSPETGASGFLLFMGLIAIASIGTHLLMRRVRS